MFKIIHHHFLWRWERFYRKNRWHLVLDISLSLVIVILAACLIVWHLYNPGISLFKQSNAPVSTSSSSVDLNNPPVEISCAVADPVIKKDQATLLTIKVKNKGEIAANNLTVHLVSADKNFSVSDVKIPTPEAKATLHGQDVVFDELTPNEDRSAQVSVAFLARNAEARVVSWQAVSEYSYDGRKFKEAVYLPNLKLAADLTVKAAVYYTSPQGDQLGVGPIPPMVGLPTSYWLFLEFKSTGDFKDLVFSGRLPQGVELSTGRSLLAGSFNYTAATRQFIWKIPELKGKDENGRIGVEIKLTPTAKQLGQVLPLVSDLKYYGVDSLTGENFNGKIKSLSTNLELDRFNSGQGKVIGNN